MTGPDEIQHGLRKISELALAEMRRRAEEQGFRALHTESDDPSVRSGWWVAQRDGSAWNLSGKRGPFETELAALSTVLKD